ncbi:MAG: hypothetical protein A3C47_04765 [Omnitrophica bacterium RIFCSPHIGHO2_02_FULL_51_18]|nr:MAG: hypothetical protein A3C47_04765 [Omnitrophica bacterium RIFCSPHIGHO2_02_FULL_51_18]
MTPEETQHSAETFYRDYWVGQEEVRKKRNYYDRLYGRLKHRIEWKQDWKILDVAGGNGQLMQYFNIPQADILDISRSGLAAAKCSGYRTIFGDIQKRFPIAENTYDAAFLFEVLEHLPYPNKTLSETHHVLKRGGVLYVGQPNMRADGVHHVRRYYQGPLLEDLEKAGFLIEWIDYVPAYSMPEAILSDIHRNPSWIRKAIQSCNLILSLFPHSVRYRMAKTVPDRFALLFVVKAVKR